MNDPPNVTSTLIRPARTPGHSLDQLAGFLGLPADPAWSACHVTGIIHAAQAVRPGDLFVAMGGQHAHGADFLASAVAAGAVAVLTDPEGAQRISCVQPSLDLPVLVVPQPRTQLGQLAAQVYGEPSRDLLVIGITGTNGKTTTTWMAEAGLRAAGHATGLVSTVETRIRNSSMPSARTTPEATDLQALFAVMREHDVTAAVMEVSSHALSLGRVNGTCYRVAVFTNLSQDHLDYHADMESYFAAKAQLFTPARCRAGVINLDDPYGRRLAGTTRAPVTTFSITGDSAADWRADQVTLGPAGSTFRITGPTGVVTPVSIRLPGLFNVANAVAAIVALVTAEVKLSDAVNGVAALPGVPGRMESIDAGQPFLAVVDYAHTPDAVTTVLTALRRITPRRLYVVLGCGGDRDATKRPLMGAAAAQLADVAILTNDNPRSEDPHVILAAIRAGAHTVPADHRAQLVVEPDRDQAIAFAVSRAEAGDTVLIAGKGHEQGQQAHGVTRSFDDRTVVRQAITRDMTPEARG